MANPEYLAAFAEDTVVSEVVFAGRVAGRITSKGLTGQFSRTTTAKNAWELDDYLKARADEKIGAPDLYLDASDAVELKTLREAEAAAGLPFSATEATVRDMFQSHGLNPIEVYLARDRATERLRGFGFVSMTSQAEAAQAIGALNGSLVEGRSLTVRPATPRGQAQSAD